MSHLFSRRLLLGATGAAALVPIALAKPAAAVGGPGPLLTMNPPVRAFDTRNVTPFWNGSRLAPGTSLGVPLGGFFGGEIGLSAFVNVTVTQTVGAGFLTIRASDATGEKPLPDTSNINWSSADQTLANLCLTAVGFESYIEIHCTGTGGTHVIVDLQGFVPFVV